MQKSNKKVCTKINSLAWEYTDCYRNGKDCGFKALKPKARRIVKRQAHKGMRRFQITEEVM